MSDRYAIRAARQPDLAALAALEREIFTDPWPRSAFASELHDVALVAEHDAAIVGYIVARAIADEGEIRNLAVAAGHRGRGVGRQLLGAGLARLAARGARAVYLEVRASNRSAQEFYRRHGFCKVGRRPRYYRRPPEDAVVMARRVEGGVALA